MVNSSILVTGGAGSIGSEIVRQLAPNNTVYIIDNNETALFDIIEELRQAGHKVSGHVGDVRDEINVEGIEYIFHCAALKHVTPSQWTPMEYVKTNINGTYNAILCAERNKAKLVNISTDKVVHAESIMGATKKVAEIMVKNAGYTSVRFGNVMGSRGSVLPIWQRQIDSGQALTVTDSKMTRYMMTIPQAVELVIEASNLPHDGKIVILDMGSPVNILDLAKGILERSGSTVGIREIGVRPGETLTEELMSPSEKLRATKEGNFYIL